MGRFLAGVVTGALLLFVAMHYHIVRSDEGFHLVPKVSNNLSNVYVDIRDFSLDDWRSRKIVAAALVRHERGDLVGHSAGNRFRGLIDSAVDNLFSE